MEHLQPVQSAADLFEAADLVPAYVVPKWMPENEEARWLANAVSVLADRLVRLEAVYGRWHPFEPDTYFDLRPPHAELMCEIEESGRFVHVRIYTDLLSPSFRAAERFFVRDFLPSLQSLPATAFPHRTRAALDLQDQLWPQLQAKLNRAQEVLSAAIEHLLSCNRVDFLVTWGASEEARRFDGRGTVAPTLTLDFSFPIPASRHPRRKDVLGRRFQRKRTAGRPLLRQSGCDRLWYAQLRKRKTRGRGE